MPKRGKNVVSAVDLFLEDDCSLCLAGMVGCIFVNVWNFWFSEVRGKGE